MKDDDNISKKRTPREDDMDNVEAPEEETTLTELEADPDVEPLTFPEPSLSTTPRPQSGLALIISSYCSSDEEL